ncbi:MAG: monovalent cation:proton antiporter-2 (CPA2) family protein [Acidobacteriota bacterium]|nr:monovalent cation:proton antiporter-2 (CPA2) family protein [Acidobacteriota bacterium]
MEFLQPAFVFLTAAVLAVPIAKRLGLGSVLGYLIAGVIIGPVLGIVGAESEDIKHFAEFGVVMMLFLVGLELQPSMLWRMRAQLVGLGGMQVAVTALLLAGGGMALGVGWRISLATGIILSLSSTAIVLQTLNEKGLMKTPGGKSSFSVLLCQDIAVIPMIALLPLLAVADATGTDDGHGAHHSLLEGLPGYLQALIIVGVIAAIIVGGHYLLRPAFRFIASSRLREIFTAAALLLVIAIALAMNLVGLSPALGTFLAGVVLSSSEYRHELESDIDPFKGLLLGLFFITVGAGIDFNLLFGKPAIIFGLTFGVMAVKFIILAVLGKMFKLSGGDYWLFALGLAQAGEFGFVLLGFARTSAVMPAEPAALLSLVVALSMLLTPALFILHEKVIAPRMAGTGDREADVIDETGSIVIAGIGRFGQIINRILTTNGFKSVVLDHDSDLIEMIRKVGYKTYYGDATRPDLLHAAGIGEAKLFIAALDDRERQTQVVHHVAREYPDCRIIARAFDRHHVYELQNAGAHEVVRELFESSLDAGRRALVSLGMHPYHAERKAQAFRKHDFKTLAALKAAWDEAGADHKYLDQTRDHARELERVMSVEAEQHHDTTSRGWTPPPKGDALV